jgi:hypothetical protein
MRPSTYCAASQFAENHGRRHVAYLNGEKFRSVVARLLWNCDDLRRYLANNTGSLIDYGERFRSKLPISTSKAEGCVDEIANARMAKTQRMRWSPARRSSRRRRPRRRVGCPTETGSERPPGALID